MMMIVMMVVMMMTAMVIMAWRQIPSMTMGNMMMMLLML